MNWPQVLLGAAGGAAGALIGFLLSLLVPASARNKQITALLAVIGIAVGVPLADHLFGARLQAAQVRKAYEETLATDPLFVIVAEEMPNEFAAYRAEVMTLIKGGANAGKLADHSREWGRTQLSGLLLRHASRASDDSVMTLARESVSMLDAVGQLDAEQCYGWLFGGAPPASDAVRAVFKQREPGLQQTVVAVVSSGRSKAHAPANAQAAQRDLREVFQTIAQTDGQAVVDTLVKLADRDAMKRDFGLACRSTATLYRRVLELEPASAANTLRFMYAAGAT